MSEYFVSARHAVGLPGGGIAGPGETVDVKENVDALVKAGLLIARKTPKAKGGSSA